MATLNASKKQAAKTVGAAETALTAAGKFRHRATIQNLGPGNLFVGPAGVTAATGLKLVPGATFDDEHSQDAWHGVADQAGTDVRILEIV